VLSPSVGTGAGLRLGSAAPAIAAAAARQAAVCVTAAMPPPLPLLLLLLLRETHTVPGAVTTAMQVTRWCCHPQWATGAGLRPAGRLPEYAGAESTGSGQVRCRWLSGQRFHHSCLLSQLPAGRRCWECDAVLPVGYTGPDLLPPPLLLLLLSDRLQYLLRL
jgi:hypothetical protein